jgi:hypothetical protein
MKYTFVCLTLLICLAETACVGVGTIDLEATNYKGQELANDLENKQDVIATLEQYWGGFERRCEAYTGGYGGKEHCFLGDAFAEKDVDLACVDSWRNPDYYDSDKCVDMRKNLHHSIVEYFDYNRFLPKPNKIHTDNDFARLSLYYRHIYDCDKIKNATEQQVEDCKKQIADMSVKIATKGAKCSEMYKFTGEYERYLYDQNMYYQWAIKHDPKTRYYYDDSGEITLCDTYCYIRFYGDIEPHPVHNKQKALNGLELNIKEFGRINMCDINGWQEDIRKIKKKYATHNDAWQQKLEFEWLYSSPWTSFGVPGVYDWFQK